MLIVMVIAAILIFTMLKPILRGASDTASGNLAESKSLVGTAISMLRLHF